MGTLKKLMRAVGDRCPAGRLPDDYLVVDVETSGLDWVETPGERLGVIIQIGYAVILGRQLADSEAYYVKRPPGTMAGTRASEVTGITDETLDRLGVPPEMLYPGIVRLFDTCRDGGCMFVGHNFVSFDAPFISHDFARHGVQFRFHPGEFIDSGMLFKAARIGLVPGTGEDLQSFFRRIKDTRSRQKWNLAFAVHSFGIDEKDGLDLNRAHDAVFDCIMTYYLLEEMRNLAENTPDGF